VTGIGVPSPASSTPIENVSRFGRDGNAVVHDARAMILF
jgi:hypothetical protein